MKLDLIEVIDYVIKTYENIVKKNNVLTLNFNKTLKILRLLVIEIN